MRLNTFSQIKSIQVSKHQSSVMLYLGETAGSICMSVEEAADLHSRIGAVLPARSLPPVDRLLRAIKFAESESQSAAAEAEFERAELLREDWR